MRCARLTNVDLVVEFLSTMFVPAATERSHMMSVITKIEDLHHVDYPALYQVSHC